MRQVPQLSCKTVVGAIVGRILDRVSADHCCGSMLVVRGIVDEVDLAQELLLMMLELSHHVGDGEVVWMRSS